ncbi:hypothetical protein [Nocardia rhamnosiphila]
MPYRIRLGSCDRRAAPGTSDWSVCREVITVEHTSIDGSRTITVFERGIARLVAYEGDHLHGMLYTDRGAPQTAPIPIERYRAAVPPGRTDSAQAFEHLTFGVNEVVRCRSRGMLWPSWTWRSLLD